MLARELPPETRVDLLKHALCVGEARRLMLDELARHRRVPFTDHRDFVAYVRQQKLGLDVARPTCPNRATRLGANAA